ncbi:GIDE domain-containing protein [Roseiflexus sp.]|uniref:GIDE domain-containing protein n=1 Tax=Roseiflexus sp. TaxID=2562120 RepID=UPI00398ACCF3
MEIIGIILLIVAGICLWLWRRRQTMLTMIGATTTYTADLLEDIHRRVATAVGADALAQRCEVSGVVEMDAPLLSKVSSTMCAAYRFTISREYEETITETDSQGKTQTTVQRGSEVIESGDVRTLFYVRDETGRILVDPEGADIEWQNTASAFELAHDPGFARRRTLGMRRTEQALPVGERVFVLGYAVDRGGRPALARSPKGERMIISRKNERQLIIATERSARRLMIAAIACGALGVALFVWRILT